MSSTLGLSIQRPALPDAARQVASGLSVFGLTLHPVRLTRLACHALATGGKVSVAAAITGAALAWGDRVALTDKAGDLTYNGLARMTRRLAAALAHPDDQPQASPTASATAPSTTAPTPQPNGAPDTQPTAPRPLPAAAQGDGEPQTYPTASATAPLRAAVLLGDDRRFLVALGAAQALGAAITVIDPRAGIDRLRQLSANQGFDLLLYAAEHAQAAEAILTVARRIPSSAWRTMARAVPPGSPVPQRYRNARIVMLTSGSTGTPKPIGILPRAGAPLVAAALAGPTKLRAGAAALVAPPLSHGYGLQCAVLCLITGTRMVLSSAWRNNGMDLANAIDRYSPRTVFAVPTQLRSLAAHLRAGGKAPGLDKLKAVVSGSDRLDAVTVEALTSAFGPVLVNYYGSTETGTALVATPQMLAHHPDTIGRPVAGTRIEIVDDSGATVPTGQIGRLRIHSPLVSSPSIATGRRPRAQSSPGGGPPTNASAKAPQVTPGVPPRAARRTGFRRLARGADSGYTTNDLGYCDESGLVYLTGRADAAMRSGAEFTYPDLVRNLLAGVPGVVSARVWTEQDDRFGSRIAAAVELADTELTAEDLRDLVGLRLGPAHKPVRVECTRLPALTRPGQGISPHPAEPGQ
ncbi:MAG: AMP-binding protein [Bifidobacteriaceae bacterium]|jgi:fatty-acyl-CoA synthase|nr:AMP-binding protein [Bifidobacteriaceae bacterium]